MNASATNNSATLESRLRQIAILVASVDTTAARQLLMALPTEIAKRVRMMAADIGPVPPEERRALLAEFQKSQLQQKPTAAQPETARSSPESSASFAPSGFQAASEQTIQPSPSWTRLSVETLVRLVRIERPTVIAVVLQQLPAAQAAAVLQHLPRSTTRDVLHALGSMQDIDEEASLAIDEHLSERLRDYHHKMETELEQTRRINDLLAAAPPELKQQWASWMRPDVYIDESAVQSARPVSATASALNTLDRLYQAATITTSDAAWLLSGKQQLAEAASAVLPGVTAAAAPQSPATAASATSAQQQSGEAARAASLANQPLSGSSSPATNRNSPSDSNEGPHTIPFPGVQAAESTPVAPALTASQRKQLHSQMDKLLKLHPERLAQLLSGLDSQTILHSLAGASPSFMKRFRNMLEPEDAKHLDQRLQRIGTVSLRQLDEAQQRLLQAYSRMANASQNSPSTSAQQVQGRRAA